VNNQGVSKMSETNGKSSTLDQRSRDLRKKILEVMNCADRGHLSPALSLIEMLRVLYDSILHFDPLNTKLSDRDRFILSKGHGCLAQYVLLQEKGFFPEEELWNFCKPDGILGGHPEPKIPGVEFSTGSLGHGLPVGVGMAVNAKYEKLDYRVFVVMGDGECNEGSVWEAAMSASKHKLDNLIAIVDYNKFQANGSTYDVLDLEPFADKWSSFGFAVKEVDGHNVTELEKVFSTVPIETGTPTAIICHTIKGKGISFAENNSEWHHKSRLEKVMPSLIKALEE
jgi:transketolase